VPRPTPDLTGKVVVVTGANSGLGKASAVALARMGATVVMASRNREKGAAAMEEVRRRTGAGDRIELAELDLASLRSVRSLAAEVLERYDRLDVLLNNAGLVQGHRRTSVDGFEMTVGVNHLGPFLLTTLLLDRLRASAPSRIVNVSSIAHRAASGPSLVADLQSELAYVEMDAYAKSKLCNVLFTRELARRLAGTGVTANALHPGVIRSGFARGGDATPVLAATFALTRPFLLSPRQGARTQVFLASSPDVASVSGEYFVHRRPRLPSPAALDADLARWLWDQSADLVASVPSEG
jgi:NAD(P)-dependent dehydrogenase (short-subunit alcohol dehydrogenase family)